MRPRYDFIVRPRGGVSQKAEIIWDEGDPWSQYVHVCSACGYLISEVEWIIDGQRTAQPLLPQNPRGLPIPKPQSAPA